MSSISALANGSRLALGSCAMLRVYRNMTKRTRIWLLVALMGIVAAIIIVAALSTIPIRSDTLKGKVIALLSDQLESEVTIESLEGRVFPRVSVSGRGVVIRHKGRTDVPPLISIDEFEIRGSLRDLMQHPRRVGEVRLRGLQVKIPPGDDDRRRLRSRRSPRLRSRMTSAAFSGSSSRGSRRPTRSSRSSRSARENRRRSSPSITS